MKRKYISIANDMEWAVQFIFREKLTGFANQVPIDIDLVGLIVKGSARKLHSN
jgi:hypothetical protein